MKLSEALDSILEKKETDSSAKPPKKWWDKHFSEIKNGEPSYSKEQASAVVGKIWSNMSVTQKKEAREAEGKTYREPTK